MSFYLTGSKGLLDIGELLVVVVLLPDSWLGIIGIKLSHYLRGSKGPLAVVLLLTTQQLGLPQWCYLPTGPDRVSQTVKAGGNVEGTGDSQR